MAHYELNFTVPSTRSRIAFIEFSPCAFTPTGPTALVWETSGAFYVGLSDGCFIHYQIDLEGKKLVEGVKNNLFRGSFPITAMALDAESKTLALSVGPNVFAFRRIWDTSGFRFIANVSSRFNFASDPGRPVPPFPRTISFTPDNTLVVTFCRQKIADYSGLPLLKAIASASEQEIHKLNRCRIYGSEPQPDGEESQFLLINGGAATLSCVAPGVAIIKDLVTQRKIQELKHTVISGNCVPVMAHHASNDQYSIVTADRVAIKVWTARRAPHPQGEPRHGFLTRKCWVIVTLLVASVIILQRQIGRIPDVGEILTFSSRITLAFVQLCIRFGSVVLYAAEDVVSGLAGGFAGHRVSRRSDCGNLMGPPGSEEGSGRSTFKVSIAFTQYMLFTVFGGHHSGKDGGADGLPLDIRVQYRPSGPIGLSPVSPCLDTALRLPFDLLIASPHPTPTLLPSESATSRKELTAVFASKRKRASLESDNEEDTLAALE
ncbi:hypothetical protein BJ322DRAFT_1025551 [Thelephora terrestris]|uniref:Uncharacterized protein n=1 Tax=Thelephora terrestris TaxID=56493 RepID=A0A9P6L0Z2_9AGAM|nr:hypothetical protein BJ322DRAFT_1025551 [Thelephora terrestris]